MKIFGGFCLLALLYVLSWVNYLLFHVLTELFSIGVAWGVFMLVWNARRVVANPSLVFLGTAYLFVGLIDLLHTLSYKGMGVFPVALGANPATQLWISARYLESVSLVVFAVLSGRSFRLGWVFPVLAAVSSLAIASILIWPVFPDCFVDGSGLTPFKKGSEYVVCLILVAAMLMLHRRRLLVHHQVYTLMIISIAVTVAGELAFTVYHDIYGVANAVGHFAKIISFFLIYLALIRQGLTMPYEMLFREWKESEHSYKRLVEEVPLSVMRFDEQGQITYVNPFHLNVFGAGKHKVDFFIGRKIHELPGIVRAGVGPRLARVFNGEVVVLDHVYFPEFTGGHDGYQNIKAVPFLEQGRVIGGVLLRDDATQAKRHEERLARALSATPDGFWVVDRDGHIIEANQAASEMLGYSLEALVGMPIWDIDVEESKERTLARKEQIERIGHDRFETRHRRKDGAQIEVEVSVRALQQSGGQIIVFVRDITERRRNEAVLRARLRLSKYADAHSLDEVLRATLDETERLTDSRIGFIHFVDPDQQFIDLQMWSTNTVRTFCRVASYDRHYPVEKAGVWADCIRTKKPVIHNDYSRLSGRNGLPSGHAPVTRELVVPVLQDGLVTAVLGVGNKDREYSGDDIAIVSQLLTMAWDIVVRKRAEEALLSSERSLQTLMSNLPGIAFRCANDNQWAMTYLSVGCGRITGYEPETFIGNASMPFAEIIHVEDRHWVTDTIQLAALADGAYEVEFRIRHANGSIRWVQARAQLVRNGSEKKTFWEGFIDDISDRKEAEQGVVQANVRMEYILSESPAVVYTLTLDDEPRVSFASQNLTRVLGWEPDDFYDNFAFWQSCVHPDDMEAVMCNAAQLKDVDNMVQEYRFRNRDGRYLWIHDEQHVIIGADGRLEVVGAFWDTSSQREAEDALLMQRRLLRTILDGIPDVIGLLRPDHTIVEYNRAGYELLGKSATDLIGTTCDQISGSVLPCDLRIADRALQTGRSETLEQYDETFKRWFQIIATPIVDDDDRITMVVEQLQDVTAHREQEAERRRLASAIEHAAEAVVITDANRLVRYTNPAFQTMTGFAKEAVLGRGLDVLHHFDDERGSDDAVWEEVATGRFWKGRLQCRRHDGTEFAAEGSLSPVIDDAGSINNLVCVLRDISADLLMEERLLQAQKMEAIGSLAGGIAHDFNNILFPMTGYAEMLQEDLPQDSPLRSKVNEILKASVRARDLVGQILAFSRQTKQEKKAVRLQSVLKDVVKLIRASLPATIQIVQQIDQSCPPVLADPVQMHQVAMNLVTNAFHAMEGGGVLTVSLSIVAAEECQRYDVQSVQAGRCVRMSITDTGSGIDPTVIERIFDPYFTNKEPTKGTGLGLSVVHGIVKSHGGDIDIQTAHGTGTTFSIYLPCLVETAEKTTDEKSFAAPGGNEHILLVDDEPLILEMGDRLLSRLGYQVTTCANGNEALTVVRRSPEGFDVVITDLTMPGMTGEKLARELHILQPGLPIILCTGFGDKVGAEQIKAWGIREFLLKPVLRNDLAAAIRRVLESRPDQGSRENQH